MRNTFEIQGDITVIHLQRGLTTIIDTADIPRAQEFPNTWYGFVKDTGQRYVIGKIYRTRNDKANVAMHRWLMNAPPHLMVDHFDHDGFNNRRITNLRLATNAQNQQNRAKATCKTGLRGVYPKGNGFKVEVTVNKKRLYLGFYLDQEEAALVAAEARRRLMPYTQETKLLEQESESEALWQEIRKRYLLEKRVS